MRNFYRWLFRLGAAKTALDERNDADAKRNGGADALREKDGGPVSEFLDALLDELETLGVRMRRSSDDEVEFRFAFGASRDANEIAERNVAAHDEMPATAATRSATAMDALGIVRECLAMDAKRKGLGFDPAIHGKKEHAAITRAQKECEASFEECRARNKMACPYHGCQYMKAALLDELRRVKAKTADVEVVAAPSKGTFVATVRCVATTTEKVAVAQAVSAFLKRAEIVPNKDWMPTEKDYTRRDGGFVTPFDLREEDVESLDPEGDGDGGKEKDKGKSKEPDRKPVGKEKPKAKKEKEEKDDKREEKPKKDKPEDKDDKPEKPTGKEKPKDGELTEDEKAQIRERIANYRLALEGLKKKNEEVGKRVKTAKKELKTSSPDNWSKLQSMWMLSDEYRALRAVTDTLDAGMSKIQRWLDDTGKSESSWSETTSPSLNVIKQRIELVIEDFANVEAKEKAAFAKLESIKKGGEGTEPTKEKKPLGEKKTETGSEKSESTEVAARRKTLTESILSKFTKLSKKRRTEMNAYHAHTFDDCPIEVLEKMAQSVREVYFDMGENNAKCTDSVVKLGKTPGKWGNNKHTFLHELGHAVLNASKQVEKHRNAFGVGEVYMTDGCREIYYAAEEEARQFAEAKYGSSWKWDCSKDSKEDWYAEIWNKMFKAEGMKDCPDSRAIGAAVSDILCATTGGDCFEGHGEGYFTGEFGHYFRLHEIVAEVTSLICIPEVRDIFRRHFPKTVRAVETNLYGIA